ncbi:MAG: CoA-binding protein [Armatimonadota bacterium]|nr:CoA-binding protein [Armatimonadota bacterium]
MNDAISTILNAETYAVVGASRSPQKYGYLVYRSLKAAGKTAYAVNPNTTEVEGDRCYASLTNLPSVPDVAVMVVPPAVTEAAIAECAHLGIQNVWMQPGAESPAAVDACRAAGITVVSGGPCIMVGLRTLNY